MTSLVLVLATAAALGATDVKDMIRSAGDDCYSQRYDSAGAKVARLVAARPGDPEGYFWLASLLQMRVYDAGDLALVDSFNRLSDRSLVLCKQALARDSRDAHANFYYGMTQLNRANMRSWRQDKLGAARAMLDVSGHLQAALERDPSLIDAHFGIGMVEYFQAMVNRYLPGLGGSKARAYEHVRTAARYGDLCRASAAFSLAWMLAQDGKRDSAVAQCRVLLQTYPGSRSAMRLMRDVYYDKGSFRQTIATGQALEQSIRAVYADDKYALTENWLKMARAYSQLGVRDSSLALCDRILAWEQYESRVPWLPNYVRDARGLKQRLSK